MGYDPKCLELAEHFINDDQNHTRNKMTPTEKRLRTEQLAQVIQDAVEDELEDPR